ncbi:uncharacterized protein LOC142764762 isoform X1 [Rhipicephalus microplus]|uniref:uncharacterized protein LOC142764762 isoform X1 n=1 Tax=Rhipicephalus microplus TaxID=6941 RepID=UPI003F6AD11A
MDTSSRESRNQRWTSDKETRLITLYERHQLLWDSRHPHYRDRDRRERAMSNIAQGLQDEFDVVSVKNKIKWLRDYFVKELKRELGVTMKKSSYQMSSSRGYVSRWEHFHKWDFLRRIFSAEICSPSTANGVHSENQHDSQDTEPLVINGECGESEKICSVQDVSSDNSRPPTPSATLEKDAEEDSAPGMVHVCEPCGISHSSTTSALTSLVKGTRPSENHQDASEMGRMFSKARGLPGFGMSATEAVFQDSGTCPVSQILLTSSPVPENQKQGKDAVPASQVPPSDERKGRDSPADSTDSTKQEESNELGVTEFGETPSIDGFSLFVIWQLRQMSPYQRDLAMLRIRQELFATKYTADSSVAVKGSPRSSALGGISCSHATEGQQASITNQSRGACTEQTQSPVLTTDVSSGGTAQPSARTEAASV